MSHVAEQLKPMLAALSVEDRREIMLFLAGLTAEGDNAGDDAELDAILAKRMEDIRSGRVKAVPGEEFFEQLRKRSA